MRNGFLSPRSISTKFFICARSLGLPEDILELASIPPGYIPNVNLGAPAEHIGGRIPFFNSLFTEFIVAGKSLVT
jgi:hypothetical protein